MSHGRIPHRWYRKRHRGQVWTEADSLAFVSTHTTLPVPKLIGSYIHSDITYIVMSRLLGTPLIKLISGMSLEGINIVASDLKSMMDQLRALRIINFETELYRTLDRIDVRLAGI